MASSTQAHDMQRRAFLSQLGWLAAASGLAWTGRAGGADAMAATATSLPTISLGRHAVTRLVAGWNPIGGHSYLGPHMDRHMKEYFTVEQTVAFLLDCEKAGINTHQFSMSDTTPEVLRRVREHGSSMNFFGLHAGREGLEQVIQDTQPFSLAHHGGVTDQMFHEGKSQEVHDYVKDVHDRGLLAGVSAHNPDCIKRIADEGWEVDYFMCCFYFLTRKNSTDESAAGGPETLQIAYPFYRTDPTVMTRVMREVDQPCLGFKILGAGRLCVNQETVRDAFRFAFENIKPTDGVIVGMYPRFFDEVTADAQYARELALPPAHS
ncbi:MAG: aldo-keto reductase family protein [Pirellulaceae bacterium]